MGHVFQDVNGKAVMPTLTAAGEVPVNASIDVGDIEIGAVEIKNATDDTRATVGANGLYTDVRVIEAGENHIGAVGGNTVAPTVSPVCDTAQYASGDLIGGKLTVANAVRVSGGSGIIQSIVLADKAKQNAKIDVVFFKTDPSNTTFTDQAALTVNDTDLVNILGTVTIDTTDYVSFVDNSVATKLSVSLGFELSAAAGTTIFAALVSRGTPTYASATDLQLTISILQD